MNTKSIDRKPPGLLQVMRGKMRLAHMSLFTEKNYILWVRQFIAFHHGRHPREMGSEEIVQFLTYLATVRNVAGSTQNQALNALVFLFKRVLNKEAGIFEGIVWARKPEHLPVVLSVDQVLNLCRQLSMIKQMIVSNPSKHVPKR